MKHNSFLACALTLAASAFALAASAAEPQGDQAFARLEIGRGEIHVDDVGSRKDNTFGFAGGYWFTGNWGVEAGYNKLFSQTWQNASGEVHNFVVGGVAKKNFGADGNGFFLGGRLGYAYTSSKVEAWTDRGYVSGRASSGGAYYGVMGGYDVSRNFGLGLAYSRYDAYSDAHEETLNLTAEYRF